MDTNEPEELKMWLAIRADLAMPPGKLAVQAGHAFFNLRQMLHDMGDEVADVHNELYWNRYESYIKTSMPKIAVRISGINDLRRIVIECINAKIPCYTVQDAGRTVFNEPTYTVCAFGPARRNELPPFLRRLRLYE